MQDGETVERERVFLSKMNLILVQILKHEWPHNWENFVPELVEASKTGEVSKGGVMSPICGAIALCKKGVVLIQ